MTKSILQQAPRAKGKVFPSNGGCWFCWNESDEMVLDYEFDTWLHLDCLRFALEKYPDNEEAQIMSYILKEVEK